MASIFDVISGLARKGNEAAQSTQAKTLVADVSKLAAEKKKKQAAIDASIKKAGVKPSTISAPSSAPIDTGLSDLAQKAQSFPQLEGLLPSNQPVSVQNEETKNVIQDLFSRIKKPVVDMGASAIQNLNPIAAFLNKTNVPALKNAADFVGNKEKIANFLSGSITGAVEQPASNLFKSMQALRKKQEARTNTTMGDRFNDLLSSGTMTAGAAISAFPIAAQYNAAIGGLKGNEQTRGLGEGIDAATMAIPNTISSGINMIPGINQEGKDALSMLANLGLVTAGGKVGEGIGKRIDAGNLGRAASVVGKELTGNKATMFSGIDPTPFLKGVKEFAKNPIVQSLDPTGIAGGIGNTDSIKQDPLIEEAKKYKTVSSFIKANTGKDYVTVYHRTNEPLETFGKGGIYSKENKGEFFVSNKKIGQAEGYGKNIVELRVKKSDLDINDEFPSGEEHYTLSNKKADEYLKQKQQLTDIYNKAQGGEPPVPPVPPKAKTSMGGEGVPSRADIGATLDDKIDALMQKTAGYSTKSPEAPMKKGILGTIMSPITKLNDMYTGVLRKGQDVLGTKLEQGLSSENTLARNAAATLQGFFRGIAMSPERETKGMQFKGGLDVSNKRAYDVTTSLYKLIDGDTKALERVNSVLDPELATKKITFDQLSEKEKQLYGILREGLDLVHDTSYANGNISPELYAQNKGKYTPRVYDTFELPDEITAALKQSGKKIDVNPYKERGDVDSWKKEHALNDPIYSLGKRLAQVESNRVIKTYADYISNNPKFVSDVEKKGYTQLSDSPAYGNLAGKYILNNVAEDFKGFFFAREGLNKWYDAFKAFDANPIRQAQKKAQTIYNPLTHLGNATSNILFSFMTKVDPLSLTTELASLSKNTARRKQLGDYLTREGILGTSVARGEFTNQLSEIRRLASGEKKSVLEKIIGVGKNIDDKITGAYGATDDLSKIAAFSALLKKGKSLKEATRLVSDGFQNYNKVGKFYDVYAKTPLIGSAYVKFKGDFLRMLKNAAVNSPMSLVGVLMAFQAGADALSKVSGESPEDKKTRENRLGAPYIPLPNGDHIPLTWQTPFGEINVARYVSPMYNYQGTDEDKKNAFGQYASYLPFGNMIDLATQYKSDPAGAAAAAFSDPTFGPLAQALFLDRDFRGKQISDPSANKYQPSTLTPDEQRGNTLRFLQRAYTPPALNNIEDFKSNTEGGKDFYGKIRTFPQSVAKLFGVKVEQFGTKEIQDIRDKTAKYEEAKQNTIEKNITDIVKKVLSGERTEAQGEEQIKQYNDASFDVMKFAEDAKNKLLLKKTPKEKTPQQEAYTQKKAEFAAKKAAKKNEVLVQKLKEIAAQGTEEEAAVALKIKYKGLSDQAIKKLISDARN